jgi:hypothetical protein
VVGTRGTPMSGLVPLGDLPRAAAQMPAATAAAVGAEHEPCCLARHPHLRIARTVGTAELGRAQLRPRTHVTPVTIRHVCSSDDEAGCWDSGRGAADRAPRRCRRPGCRRRPSAAPTARPAVSRGSLAGSCPALAGSARRRAATDHDRRARAQATARGFALSEAPVYPDLGRASGVTAPGRATASAP